MTCQELHSKVNEFLDGELGERERAALQHHFQDCAPCRSVYQELLWVKEAFSHRVPLSEAAQRRLWQGVKRTIERDFPTRVWEFWDGFRTFYRDLDGELLWSKVSAVPVTLVFFVALLWQFPQVRFQQWTYPVVADLPLTTTIPLITQVPVRYRSAEISDLMSAVWKIPYEDSLSLVAEIQPEGHAEIGNVLEYPKSKDLLRAIDVSLRSSRFQMGKSPSQEHPFVIVSFQKVDVYGDGRGL